MDPSASTESFDAVVSNLLVNATTARSPEAVVRIQVRRWFDHKWLRFSGVGRVPFKAGLPGFADVALAPIRSDQLTFPPFTPNRFVWERHWLHRGDGRYRRVPIDEWVWSRWGPSAQNLHRRVIDHHQDCLYVWQSEAEAGRASMLLYDSNGESVSGWFAGFRHDGDTWRVGQVRNVDRDGVVAMMAVPLRPGVTFS